MNTMKALKVYTNIGIEANVDSADPHKLILLLYQGALLAIASAKNQMLRKETAKKGASISHAIAIIDSGLQTSLNKEVGGALAMNLSDLYGYMTQRLITANLTDDIAILDEISRLLTELRTAWENIGRKDAASAAPVAVPQAPSTRQQQTALVYGRK
jgi:flagellar secretion chaperone FliS